MATHEAPALPSNVARLILVWWASAFGLLTVLTHVAQVVGMTFGTYVAVGVSVTVLTTVVLLRAELPRLTAGSVRAGRGVTLGLVACCLLSATLCLVSYRPSTDDAFYVPNAVHALEHTDAAMGFAFHYVESGGSALVSHHRGSIPFEYVQAMTAHLVRLDLLTVYFVVAPAFFGLLIPLAWFMLLSRFVRSPPAAVYGTLTICLCLLLMGAQERSWGNYAFNRIFQGKTVMFTVGLPLFIALTVDYFRRPGVRDWLALLAAATAMVGCTVASAALVPLLAIVLTIAAAGAFMDGSGRRLSRSALYLCTAAYPAAYAVSILLVSLGDIGADTPLNRTWPTTFSEHATWVWDDPASIVFLFVGSVAAILHLEGSARRFLIAWFIATVVLYLNPVVASFMIRNVTSPNMYWRLFYLLPFPLVIGIAGAALMSRLAAQSAAKRLLFAGGVPSILLLAHLPAQVPSVFRTNPADAVPGTELRMPGPRVAGLDLAREVLSVSPPDGTMLAPQSVSTVVAMLTSRFRHVCYRADGIRMWFEGDGREKESRRRIMASNFLDGRITTKGLSAVTTLVQQHTGINTVVAMQAALEAENGRLERLLLERGFARTGDVQGLAVYSQPRSQP